MRMSAVHRRDYPSDTALAAAVAKKVGAGRETARRWLIHSDVTVRPRSSASRPRSGSRARTTILKSATVFIAGELDPATADHAFIDDRTAEGHAVESTPRALTEHGSRVAARTMSDAMLSDALISVQGTPEGLYGGPGFARSRSSSMSTHRGSWDGGPRAPRSPTSS